MFARGDGRQSSRNGTLAKGNGGQSSHEVTFAKGDGGAERLRRATTFETECSQRATFRATIENSSLYTSKVCEQSQKTGQFIFT